MTTFSTFKVDCGQFWWKGQPILLQAGEFHYFRAPVNEWRPRLELLQKAGFNTVAAYIPWLWHQPQPDLIDIDGHTHPLRNLAGFLDLAAEMGFFIIARPGPYIMAETINEGVPPWVFDDYRQAAFISQYDTVQNIASYLQPDFLRCVEGWYQAVFQVLTPRQATHGGRIILIQLDNEMGMLQWVRNIIDMNPDTIARFADHLRQIYGDQLRQRYPATDLDSFLTEQLTNPQTNMATRVLEDYRRFYRTYLRTYTQYLWARAQAYGMMVPPVINIHGFTATGKTFPIGLSQLVEVLELNSVISATDVYPSSIGEGNAHQLVLANEMTKALQNPQQPLFSIEFQAGGNHDFGGAQTSFYDLHTRQCIACGMRAINHYLFFDGENDPILSPVRRHDWGHPVRKDGTLRRHYARYPKLSRVLAAYGEALVRSQPKTVTTIGFLLDDFMTEVDNASTRPTTITITYQRETILFDLLARGLTLSHRPFNAVELTRAALDPAHIPTLWAMVEKRCEASVQQKLIDYVRQGGKLILVGRLPEETFDHVPCTILQQALGLQSTDSASPMQAVNIRIFDYSHVPITYLQTYTGEVGEVFARTAEGDAVGCIKQVGRGQVLLLGAAFTANTLEDLDIVHQLANLVGCPPLFSMTDWAEVRLSVGGQGSFLFVNNYQDDPLETVISSAEGVLFGGQPLTLPARRGAILPLEWQVRAGIMVHYVTSEIIEVRDEADRFLLKTDQPDFWAELTLHGYRPDEALITQPLEGGRVRLHGTGGVIELRKG